MSQFLDINGLAHYNGIMQPPVANLIDSGPKNKLLITTTNGSSSQLTWTVSDDKIITVSGTNNGSSTITIPLIGTTYQPNSFIGDYLSGINGGSSSTYKITTYYSSNGSTWASETTIYKGVHIIRDYPYFRINIEIVAGATLDNISFSPMICTKADWNISKKYVPYGNGSITDAQIDSLWENN
jgi:hypothetical protein